MKVSHLDKFFMKLMDFDTLGVGLIIIIHNDRDIVLSICSLEQSRIF